MKRNFRRAIVLPAIALMALSVSACSSGSAEQSEAPGPPKALKFQDNGGRLVIKSRHARLPKDFPDDVPVYAAAIKSTVVADGPSEPPMTMVILETEAGVKKVAAFYEKQLGSRGWAIDTGSTDGREGVVYTAAKEERAASISISRPQKGKTTVISISVTAR